jgi:protein-tyrosine phosphatase
MDDVLRRPRDFRTIARSVRHTPDRWLHNARRGLIQETLRRRTGVQSVLFVCHGNVCRSPFAAAMMRGLLAWRRHQVTSAGFGGVGHPPPETAVDAAGRRGICIANHRSELLTPMAVRASDLVVVMEPRQARSIVSGFGKSEEDVIVLGDLDPEPIVTRAIPDPVDQPPPVFDEVYARIERCVRCLVAVLSQRAA